MDDVTFGRSGPYGGRCDTGAESDVYECLLFIKAAEFQKLLKLCLLCVKDFCEHVSCAQC